jgi:hypothetical protein
MHMLWQLMGNTKLQQTTEDERRLTLSLLMSHIYGVSEKFCEWYQKTNKTVDPNKLTILAFKIIAILAAAIQGRVAVVLRSIPKESFADSFQKLYERCQQCVVKVGDYFEGQNS